MSQFYNMDGALSYIGLSFLVYKEHITETAIMLYNKDKQMVELSRTLVTKLRD